MFEEFTEDYFMDQARALGEEYGVDTRQGSLFMDAATGHCIRCAKFMNDLSTAFEMLAVDTCTGDILTEKAAQDGITRQEATPAYYYVEFEGTTPDVGTRFFCDTYYFQLVLIDDIYLLEAEITGEEVNGLVAGENVVPVYDITGLDACTLGDLYIPGAEEESDDSLRERWQEKKTGPSQNNNKSQYKTWCESITGVGRAHILPLYGGENTVLAVIYSTEGGIPADSILQDVQEYIDPIDEGYEVEVDGETLTFSDGLGEGVSDIGAHFLAAAPGKVSLSISFSADLVSGYTVSQAQEEVLELVEDYLKTLVLEGDEDIIVRVSAIGNLISQTESILDYSTSSLQVNGSSSNIEIGNEQTPIVEEVVIDA
ncbi:MAG: baseplate J/gp47 family protein [Clostridiales bacterium]|nr:baseplate J/gp47 family protein [Clostridiales bacterium]